MTSTAHAPAVRIRRVAATDDGGLRAVGRLHAELLPFGPVAALGADFLRIVAYRAPIADGLLQLAVAEVDGVPVGFAAWTADSERFHGEAVRRHLALAGTHATLALVRNPKRLRAVPRILRVMRSRVDDGEDRAAYGELIGLGVLPEYASPRFRKRTGRWISRDLVAHAADDLHAAGKERLRIYVAAENTRTLLLYQFLGGTFERLEHGGEPTIAVDFALPFGDATQDVGRAE
jgi:ribosomal protein S18 acetylase RimI-like enzyme